MLMFGITLRLVSGRVRRESGEEPRWDGMWPSGLAHDSQRLECPEEVWAARRGRVVSERETEDDSSVSDEEGGHNVENFMLCSSAHHACSPLLQGSLHEEEPCQVALTCQCFVGRVVRSSGLSGAFPEFFLTCQFLSTVAACLNASPIKEGLQHGEGCGVRQVQVSQGYNKLRNFHFVDVVLVCEFFQRRGFLP